jgi:hypothetical protein
MPKQLERPAYIAAPYVSLVSNSMIYVLRAAVTASSSPDSSQKQRKIITRLPILFVNPALFQKAVGRAPRKRN